MKDNYNNIPAIATNGEEQILQPIENLIHIVRGQQVMLDSDLARLYGVETRVFKSGSKA